MPFISKFFAHPLTRGKSLDLPETTIARREIIRTKPFLASVYREWYGKILTRKMSGSRILEVGSGAGFIAQVDSDIITSELLPITGVDLIADCQALPFSDATLDGIVMIDVFHHIPRIGAFLAEASRCVRSGGRLDMIEPWVTPWSSWVYRYLHPEPFYLDGSWEIPPDGPLSGANGALPWIVFERDKARFVREHPDWSMVQFERMMPFSYLFSGGISTRVGFPGGCYGLVRKAESLLDQKRWAMFAHIGLVRQ